MAPQRIMHGHSAIGIWLRIAILNVVVAIVTTLVILSIVGDPTADAINFTACGTRTLIDPSIKANETLIKSLKRVRDAEESTPAQVKQARARLVTVTRQQENFQAYRQLFPTVPRNYKCPPPKGDA